MIFYVERGKEKGGMVRDNSEPRIVNMIKSHLLPLWIEGYLDIEY